MSDRKFLITLHGSPDYRIDGKFRICISVYQQEQKLPSLSSYVDLVFSTTQLLWLQKLLAKEEPITEKQYRKLIYQGSGQE